MIALFITSMGAAAAVLFVAGATRKRNCPRCEMPLPALRQPRHRRQALHGGWTCGRCGCELDRRGKVIE
jgi:hypothetical protein